MAGNYIGANENNKLVFCMDKNLIEEFAKDRELS